MPRSDKGNVETQQARGQTDEQRGFAPHGVSLAPPSSSRNRQFEYGSSQPQSALPSQVSPEPVFAEGPMLTPMLMPPGMPGMMPIQQFVHQTMVQQAAMWQWMMQQQGAFPGAPPSGHASGSGPYTPGTPLPWVCGASGPGMPPPLPWMFGALPAGPTGPRIPGGGLLRPVGGASAPGGQRAPRPFLPPLSAPAHPSQCGLNADDSAAGLLPSQQAPRQTPRQLQQASTEVRPEGGCVGDAESSGNGSDARTGDCSWYTVVSERGGTILARRRAEAARGVPGASDGPSSARGWEMVLPSPPPPPPTSSADTVETAPADDPPFWDVQGAREPEQRNGTGHAAPPPWSGNDRGALSLQGQRTASRTLADWLPHQLSGGGGRAAAGGASLSGSSRQPSGELPAAAPERAHAQPGSAMGTGLATGARYGSGNMTPPGIGQARENYMPWGPQPHNMAPGTAHAPPGRAAPPLGGAQTAPRPFAAQPWQGVAVRSYASLRFPACTSFVPKYGAMAGCCLIKGDGTRRENQRACMHFSMRSCTASLHMRCPVSLHTLCPVQFIW